jgi:hypothetical protein
MGAVGDSELVFIVEPTFRVQQANAENLIIRLAAKRGWTLLQRVKTWKFVELVLKRHIVCALTIGRVRWRLAMLWTVGPTFTSLMKKVAKSAPYRAAKAATMGL